MEFRCEKKQVFIKRIENKLKNIPIHRIKLQSKIISDTVDVGVVDELPMRGIDLMWRERRCKDPIKTTKMFVEKAKFFKRKKRKWTRPRDQ